MKIVKTQNWSKKLERGSMVRRQIFINVRHVEQGSYMHRQASTATGVAR